MVACGRKTWLTAHRQRTQPHRDEKLEVYQYGMAKTFGLGQQPVLTADVSEMVSRQDGFPKVLSISASVGPCPGFLFSVGHHFCQPCTRDLEPTLDLFPWFKLTTVTATVLES